MVKKCRRQEKKEMKIILTLLSSCILFSSCYSYRSVDLSTHQILVNKKYRITTKESKKTKVKIYKVSDSTITFVKKGIKTEIPLYGVKDIKKRRFSYLKTIGFTVSMVLISTIIYAICCWTPLD